MIEESTTPTELASCISLVLPYPNCPLSLAPQHFRLESSRIAQVCAPPEETATVFPPVVTEAGELLDEGVDPIPSCPLELLPQQLTLQSSRTAQVCCPPADTASTLLPLKSTGTGLLLWELDPSPS